MPKLSRTGKEPIELCRYRGAICIWWEKSDLTCILSEENCIFVPLSHSSENLRGYRLGIIDYKQPVLNSKIKPYRCYTFKYSSLLYKHFLLHWEQVLMNMYRHVSHIHYYSPLQNWQHWWKCRNSSFQWDHRYLLIHINNWKGVYLLKIKKCPNCFKIGRRSWEALHRYYLWSASHSLINIKKKRKCGQGYLTYIPFRREQHSDPTFSLDKESYLRLSTWYHRPHLASN